jgi:hypothetical protein
VTAFDVAAHATFADRNLAEDALHRAGGTGGGTVTRAIRRAPDQVSGFNDARFLSDTILLDMPTASVPLLARGDTIEIGASIYEVRADPVRDADRLIWTAEAREL